MTEQAAANQAQENNRAADSQVEDEWEKQLSPVEQQDSEDEADDASPDGKKTDEDKQGGEREDDKQAKPDGEADDKDKAKESDAEPETTYLDFDQESLPSEQVRARIAAETKIKAKLREEAKAERQRRLDLEKELLEFRKPKPVEKPPEDLAYENHQAYAKQLNDHYESQKQQEEYDARVKALEEQAQREQLAEQQRDEQEFITRAKSRGYSEEQLNQMSKQVESHLVENIKSQEQAQKAYDLIHFVFQHEYGDKMLDTLSRKPEQLSELINMSAAQAGAKLADIARAMQQQTYQSKAPPPDEPLRGGGAPPSQEGPEGATYE